MGSSERRERDREQLRQAIVEAARDIVSEQGLDALSMRALAERIEYSPATIYLYFRDKDELIRTVVHEGFARLNAAMQEELLACGGGATATAQYAATGRAYARFALENTGYFRVMFEIPSVAQMECPEPEDTDTPMTEEQSWGFVVSLLERAMAEQGVKLADPERRAIVGWGLVHGLTSLFVSGHLSRSVESREAFMALIEEAMSVAREGLAFESSSDVLA